MIFFQKTLDEHDKLEKDAKVKSLTLKMEKIETKNNEIRIKREQ